jgi:beta-N-acetylhexosaminidase
MKRAFNPGRFLILGFDGLRPSKEFCDMIEKDPPAGFLLLGHNFESLNQMRELVSDLKRICGEEVIIAVDQEPGRVQRFKGEFPLSRQPSYYLKPAGIAEFRSWCRTSAELLNSAGVNLNLAPVVDLYPIEKAPAVLRDRVFGDDPERVAEFAMVLIEEFKRAKVMTCAKHFPGLGCGIGDPHEKMTGTDERLERFLDYHWRPFKAVVKANVDCIMTTHLLASAIDPENCATYSRNTITHARNTVGHQGMVVSDDLSMVGAGTSENIGEASVRSLLAGHNLVIITRTIPAQTQAMQAIGNRVEEDAAFRAILKNSERKADSFKNALV